MFLQEEQPPLQLMATLQQQEQRILQREKRLHSAEVCADSAAYAAAGAASASMAPAAQTSRSDLLHRTHEAYPFQSHQPLRQWVECHTPDRRAQLLPLDTCVTGCDLPTAAHTSDTKQAKSHGSEASGSAAPHPKGLVLHPTVDVSKLEDPQPNPSPPTQPTKQNILIALNWLVRDAMPGDRLFFYFSGHSTQVDNLSAYEGEGYDEALLPVDFDSLGSEDDANLLLTTHVKETILDPAGTGSVWTFIKGPCLEYPEYANLVIHQILKSCRATIVYVYACFLYASAFLKGDTAL
ncbi:ice-like protease p20 domain-containing protein [Cyclospora cayetanensis]|uniref:Ice-like protease p20 domain-containing protein n=1 Tax=Cyclospora cayetanensis TaxID=88456 RepID=A0A1D3D5V5_9EIME|nr:ice-like protease p20 domain-containing protein [Cyclospora cayetanensis]